VRLEEREGVVQCRKKNLNTRGEASRGKRKAEVYCLSKNGEKREIGKNICRFMVQERTGGDPNLWRLPVRGGRSQTEPGEKGGRGYGCHKTGEKDKGICR